MRWALPDRVFFACGACHILAHAFLTRWQVPGAKAVWIKPAEGYTGNHIFVDGGDWVFDYHGYVNRQTYLRHTSRRAQQRWAGWEASLIELPEDVLISETKSRTYDGLWLRQPDQFLHDAMPRALAYLERFAAPPPPP